MSDKIREALVGMLAIHNEPSGFAGKYGRALDEAIAAQQVKIDQRIAAARAALALRPDPPTSEHPDKLRSEINALRTTLLHVYRQLAEAERATEQPDTVAVPRELLEELADIADAMQCYDARDDAIALLAGGAE